MRQNGAKGGAGQRTLVFDEIDFGIGGRAAEAVGKKLKQLAGTKQVLCITHLPQIASFADQHYLIEKEGVGRADQDVSAATRCGGPHGRAGADDQRREADRRVAQARRTDAEDESMRSFYPPYPNGGDKGCPRLPPILISVSIGCQKSAQSAKSCNFLRLCCWFGRCYNRVTVGTRVNIRGKSIRNP